jgi:hypothetical protein
LAQEPLATLVAPKAEAVADALGGLAADRTAAPPAPDAELAWRATASALLRQMQELQRQSGGAAA